MIHTPLATYLALNKIDGFGVRHIAELEKNHADITQILQLSNQDLLASGWQEKHIELWRKLSWNNIQNELMWAEKPGNHILYWHDPNYPRLLKEIHRPPVILYVQGQVDALQRSSMAIVGTRHPTGYGKENTRYFTKELAETGFCICSGLAIGIDGIAHHTALPYPAGTTAVVATGLDQIYPERHKTLASQILENGAIVSEFPFKTPPRPENFPRRNRIISGLSRGVVVIEAALKSGSLITARYAMEQGREVFAVPGVIQNTQTHGCHSLIRQGAVLVSCLEDILEEFTGLPVIIPNKLNVSHLINTTPENKKQESARPKSIIPESIMPKSTAPILEHIEYGISISMDELIEKSGIAVDEISAQLLELELLGMIDKAADGGYQRSFSNFLT